MKRAHGLALVLVTAPDLQTARQLADGVLQAKLVACVNLVPRLESHYWWRGKLERNSEVLMILKTRRKNLRQLELLLCEAHPYDTPEFLVLGLHSGSDRYLDWIAGSC